MTDLTWLTVGGCPRSGTTALGQALNQSSHIKLLHEYASHVLFDSLNIIFSEEKRHRLYSGFSNYEDFIPQEHKHAAKIVSLLFELVFDKAGPVVGTKFPGHHLWPKPSIPSGVQAKELMIIRNPFDVVLSYSLKMVDDGEVAHPAGGATRALSDWVNAWNYAVLNHKRGDFFAVFYDEIDANADFISQQIAQFLNVECDFSIDTIRPRAPNAALVRYEFEKLELVELHNEISGLWHYDDWRFSASTDLNKGRLVGMRPEAAQLRFEENGNGLCHVQHGFYPAELHGSWTNGGSSLVVLAIPQCFSRTAKLNFEVIWSLDLGGEWPVVSLFVDDQLVSNLILDLGSLNGRGKTFSFEVPEFSSDGCGTSVEFRVLNPRNPKTFGLSHDDRELGFMLRSLTLE